jgi:hypothetical protein
MADISELIIKIDSDGVVRATGNLEVFSKAAEDAAKSTDKTKSSAKSLITTLENQVAVLGMNARELAIFKAQTKKATDEDIKRINALHDEIDAYQQKILVEKQAGKGLGDLSKATRSNVAPMKDLRSQAQQASYQLQDIAVQAQMGTSWFTIFGQQGSQLASVFGKSGAVYGALIAFGAILAGAIYNNMMKTGDAADRLSSEMDKLADSYDDATEAQRAFLRLDAAKTIEQNKNAMADLEEELDQLTNFSFDWKEIFTGQKTFKDTTYEALELQTKIDALKKSNKDLADSVSDINQKTRDYAEGIVNQRKSLELTGDALLRHELRLEGVQEQYIETALRGKKYILNLEKIREETKKSKEANKSYFDSLANEYWALSLTGDALYEYQARTAGVTEENIEGAVAISRNIARLKEEAEATKKTAAEKDAAAKQAEAQRVSDKEKAIASATEMARLGESEIEAFINTQKIKRAELDESLAQQFISHELHAEAVKGLNDELNAYTLEKNKTYLDEWFAQVEETTFNVDMMQTEMASSLQAGFAGAIEGFLSGTETAKEALKGLVMSIGQSMVTMIANNLAQLAAAYIVQKIMGKTAEASAAAAMTMNALAMQQMASLNAYASTAAIPVVGPGLAPAAAAAALAATTPMVTAITAFSTTATAARALGGQVRGGESYLVGERGPELLTMGTSGRIATNENLKKAVGSQGETVQQNVSVNFSIQANDTAGFDRLLNSRRGQIMSMINQAVNDRGRASLA